MLLATLLAGAACAPAASLTLRQLDPSGQDQEVETAWGHGSPVSSRGRVNAGGRDVAYTATCGTLALTTEEGEVEARVFFTAYTLDGQVDPSVRPVTFTFNGGPGSSSVWLHMGAFGPRRVAMNPEGSPLPPPGVLVDNEHSLLDVTDLVFIDPVTTGFSRAAEDIDDSVFHGVEEDVESVGQFVHEWVSRNDRWASPKFLCGESYGTTRAAALTAHLQERYGMYMSGAVLVSAVLDFQTLRTHIGNDLPYILILPSFAATAQFHNRLSLELMGDLEVLLDEVEEFARGEYASALFQGSRLPPEERRAVAVKLARYTGLDVDFVLASDLRVSTARFTKELRRSERMTVGRLDSRFTGRDRDAAGEAYEYDPSYAAILGPYAATVNDYLRRELGYETGLPYEILTGRVHPWKMEEGGFVNVAEDLRGAMARNPHLQVFVANGYYDLATPYFATEYTFDHLAIDDEYQSRVSMGYYPAGHMMYIQESSHAALARDVRAFYSRVMRGAQR